MTPRLLFTSDPLASKPKEWLVRGVFAQGETSVMVAPPFVGKSTLSTDLSASVGLGVDWFRHPTARSSTLYVAQERAMVTARRLRAFEVYHEVKEIPVGLLLERLHVMEKAKDAAETIKSAVEACEQRTAMPVGLIVFDTVAALAPGNDENSPRDMGRVLDFIGRVRDRVGSIPHIALVHHTPNDDPKKPRGHTSLAGAVDTIVVLSMKGSRRTWSVNQANDLAEKPSEKGFELQTVHISRDADGVPTTAPVVVPVVDGGDDRAQSPEDSIQKPIKGDARVGLEVLRQLHAKGGPVSLPAFREALFASTRFQAKKSDGARRQGLSQVRETLEGANLIREEAGHLVIVS